MTRPRNTGVEMAKLVVCYLLAVTIGAAVFGVFSGFPAMIPFAALAGAVLGLPALLVALLLFVSFTESIHRRPTLWCVAVPFVASAVFGVFLQVVMIQRPLFSGELLGFVALSFVGAAVAAYTFRFWALGPEAGVAA